MRTYKAMGLDDYDLSRLQTDAALLERRAQNEVAGFRQDWDATKIEDAAQLPELPSSTRTAACAGYTGARIRATFRRWEICCEPRAKRPNIRRARTTVHAIPDHRLPMPLARPSASRTMTRRKRITRFSYPMGPELSSAASGNRRESSRWKLYRHMRSSRPSRLAMMRLSRPCWMRTANFTESPRTSPRCSRSCGNASRRGIRSYSSRANDGTLFGFAHLLLSLDTLSLRPIGILEDIYVTEAARGQGVGGALLDAAEAYARECGLARLTLSTAHQNRTAQRLYLAKGYVPDQRFRSFNRFLTNVPAAEAPPTPG